MRQFEFNCSYAEMVRRVLSADRPEADQHQVVVGLAKALAATLDAFVETSQSASGPRH